MAATFEALMVICFGLSWPLSVYKSWKSRTAKGKSLFFEVFILLGYLCGMTGKIVSGSISYVFIFYVINALMVSADLCLYFRNRRLDKAVHNRS
ncbi:MAG: hypothetical protein LBK98_09405 [Peptococcaceae bacterium]|jgi:formate hydrogenlyase subunit 3/multisubunit Na+/H+ antiporter MnhD subunit|nr:hypothetical protein [Peptococcaceae bacterium]